MLATSDGKPAEGQAWSVSIVLPWIVIMILHARISGMLAEVAFSEMFPAFLLQPVSVSHPGQRRGACGECHSPSMSMLQRAMCSLSPMYCMRIFPSHQSFVTVQHNPYVNWISHTRCAAHKKDHERGAQCVVSHTHAFHCLAIR